MKFILKYLRGQSLPNKILWCFLIINVAAFSFLFLENLFNSTEQEDKVETDEVYIAMANHRFLLPEKYLVRYNPVIDAERDSLSMIFSLPEFGATAKNLNYFRKRKTNSLHINISYRGISYQSNVPLKIEAGSFQRSLHRCGADIALEPVVHGDLFVYKCGNSEFDKLYTNKQHSFSVICDSLDWRNPHCEFLHENEVYGDLSVFYYFDAEYAANSQQIHNFVVNVITQMKADN